MHRPRFLCRVAALAACLPLLVVATLGNRVGAATPNEPSSSEVAGGWRLVHSANPRGGPGAVSIMHTADTTRSDLEFAGLMIRCNGNRAELLLILLRAFPLRAHPLVTLGQSGHETQFKATVGPPGTALVLPGDPKTLIGDLWQSEGDLSVRVLDNQTTTSGVISLAGLRTAFARLMTSCPVS